MQKINLGENIEFTLFQIEQAIEVEKLATEIGGVVYSWQTAEGQNWFQKGFTVVDALGLVVLPVGLPEMITLPNDNLSQKQ